VCGNAYRLYVKTRPAPSVESVARAKQLPKEGTHPLLRTKVNINGASSRLVKFLEIRGSSGGIVASSKDSTRLLAGGDSCMNLDLRALEGFEVSNLHCDRSIGKKRLRTKFFC
jgi:hypothetical protein